MKILLGMAILTLGLALGACTPPAEEEALSKQSDIAVVQGLCTDLTVATLNKVHQTSVEDAAPACHELQTLLKGRTCENGNDTFPEDEQLAKCEAALKAEKEKLALGAPTMDPTDRPVAQPAKDEIKACAIETMAAIKDLKKMKTSLEKRKSRSTSSKALALCKSLNASLTQEPCEVEDTKSKAVVTLTLKDAGLESFCSKLSPSK